MTTRSAVAAATPVPLASAVNSEGATALTGAETVTSGALGLWTVKAAMPSAVSAGTRKLTWLVEAKNTVADLETAALSFTVTVTPELAPRVNPKMEAIAPGANGSVPLAAEPICRWSAATMLYARAIQYGRM